MSRPKGVPNKPKMSHESQAPEVVEIEEANKKADKPSPSGTKFFFGEIMLLTFTKEGKTDPKTGKPTREITGTYHITKRRETISDPELIANLKEAMKNPHNKIFIEA